MFSNLFKIHFEFRALLQLKSLVTKKSVEKHCFNVDNGKIQNFTMKNLFNFLYDSKSSTIRSTVKAPNYIKEFSYT